MEPATIAVAATAAADAIHHAIIACIYTNRSLSIFQFAITFGANASAYFD